MPHRAPKSLTSVTKPTPIDPQVDPESSQNRSREGSGAPGQPQVRPKSAKKPPKSAPKAPRERPGSAPRLPKGASEGPEGRPRGPKGAPRRPRWSPSRPRERKSRSCKNLSFIAIKLWFFEVRAPQEGPQIDRNRLLVGLSGAFGREKSLERACREACRATRGAQVARGACREGQVGALVRAVP